MCFENYITIDSDTPSRSGKYAVQLPGVSLSMLQSLTNEDQADYLELWEIIYARACGNMVSDISQRLQSKFFVDHKLVSRETSFFKEVLNETTGLSGVSIEFDLPKYGRLHVISVGVDAEEDIYEFELDFFEDDADGRSLATFEAYLVAGRNTINIDTDFEVNKLFVAYDSDQYSLYKTKDSDYRCSSNLGIVKHVNGGGLNIKYVITCSIEKFVCENINLFAQALWYRVGLELTIERRFGEVLSKFTTMTIERAEELTEFFQAQYTQALDNAIKSNNIEEDAYCFNCKNTVYSRTLLP